MPVEELYIQRRLQNLPYELVFAGLVEV